MTQKKGQFIVVEGLEGAGKSTAIDTIKTFMKARVDEVVLTHEPGGTSLGNTLRQLIKQADSQEPLDARAELLLMYASRVQLVEHVINPALARGECVLSDRFELSSYAYQGGGRGLSEELISTLSRFCLKGLKPDWTFFLDVAPEEGLKRALARSAADRIEQESVDFFHKVYAAYHRHLKSLPNVSVIDASLPMAEVQQQLNRALQTYWAHAQ